MVIFPIEGLREEHHNLAGGKGFALARLKSKGLNVPKAVCLTSDAYRSFIYERWDSICH